MPTITPYSEKSFVVRDADLYVEQITHLGGKYNELLRDGPGWIFGNFKRESVEAFIKSCANGNSVIPKVSTKSAIVETVNITKQEYLAILSRLERLEQLIASSTGGKPVTTVSTKSAQIVFSEDEIQDEKPPRLLRAKKV